MWPFKKREEVQEELTLEKIYPVYTTLTRFLSVGSLFPKIPSESSKEFRNWQREILKDKRLVPQLKKAVLSFVLIIKFFTGPFYELHFEELKQDTKYVKTPLIIILTKGNNEIDKKTQDFLFNLYNNKITEIFADFLEQKNDLIYMIDLLRSSYDVVNSKVRISQCDDAKEAIKDLENLIPGFIIQFSELMKSYLEHKKMIAHEILQREHVEAVEGLERSSGRVYERYPKRKAA